MYVSTLKTDLLLWIFVLQSSGRNPSDVRVIRQTLVLLGVEAIGDEETREHKLGSKAVSSKHTSQTRHLRASIFGQSSTQYSQNHTSA